MYSKYVSRNQFLLRYFQFRVLRRVEHSRTSVGRRKRCTKTSTIAMAHSQGALPSDHPAWLLFYQWFFSKCVASIRIVADILFTDEARMTRDGVVNCHYTLVWVDGSPHTITASTYQHRFYINICVRILGIELLGPVVLLDTHTGEVYPRFCVKDLPAVSRHMLLHQRQNGGSFTTRHDIIYSAMSHSTRSRHSANS